MDTISVFENEGDLYYLCCMRALKINKINLSIGIGPSLLLMTIKALWKFFLVMTIINIPTMMLYYDFNWFLGASPRHQYLATSPFDIFAQLSLGNFKKRLSSTNYKLNLDTSRGSGNSSKHNKKIKTFWSNKYRKASGYDYLGCFKDSPVRVFPVNSGYGFTAKTCYEKASKLGYNYFALQNGGWCTYGWNTVYNKLGT